MNTIIKKENKYLFEKIKNFIFYGGISKAEYSELRSGICKSNIKNILVFSAIAAAAYTILCIVDSYSESLSIMKTIHVICLIACFVLFSFAFIYSKTNFHSNFPTYVAIFTALILGVILGIFVNANEQTTSFMVFLLAIPLLFTIKPVYLFAVIFLADSTYIFLVLKLQKDFLRVNNFLNAIAYGIVSIIISSYMMMIKIRALNTAKKYKFLMENDQLTGLNNRLSYNSHLKRIQNSRENCIIVEFDINGLKEANDTKGHSAGDEIITGTAACIKQTFDEYGKCFRIGGDEFVAILDKPLKDEKKLLAEFEANCKKWKGEFNSSLSVAYGAVNLANYPDSSIEEILATADKLMYQNKNAYYTNSGKDRRKRISDKS